ncbi:uncharacterized protein [Ptychodera flava]|uniref:uncharacterized protein n=1 Tax=Ptychodera flava TaxID=63121 RepID=UPI00396A6B09
MIECKTPTCGHPHHKQFCKHHVGSHTAHRSLEQERPKMRPLESESTDSEIPSDSPVFIELTTSEGESEYSGCTTGYGLMTRYRRKFRMATRSSSLKKRRGLFSRKLVRRRRRVVKRCVHLTKDPSATLARLKSQDQAAYGVWGRSFVTQPRRSVCWNLPETGSLRTLVEYLKEHPPQIE